MVMVHVLEGSAFFAGVAMGTASILSIGPNNLTLIREGVSGGRVVLVATTFWTSRLLLLVSALVLTDVIATQGSRVRPVLSWLGLVVLCYFAYGSLKAYRRSSRELRIGPNGIETYKSCLRRILAIVWLNPLTYIEQLFVPATIGASFIMPSCRMLFIGGLVTMMTASCYGYAFGGRLCAPVFRRNNMMRMFDLTSCILLSSMACAMAVTLCLRPV